MTERVYPRRIKSYVTRAGRVSAAQERALTTYAPVFGLAFQTTPPDLPAVFGRVAPLVVEIGFGMGETTAELAELRPELNFIGIEVHTPGVGALYKLLGARGLTNVRIIQHDAVEIFDAMLRPATVSGIHIFFPDPWHKARHHKRRLVSPAFATLLASRLAPGGYVHLATDWEDYATQMLEVLTACAELVNQGTPYASRTNPWFDRPRTKFEARGLKLGHEVRDLIFTRAP